MSKQEEIKQALELLHKGGAVPLNVVEAVNDLLEENERLRSALETTLFHLKKEYYMSAEDSIEEALAVGQEGEGNQEVSK
ncbi:hypothetical protein [Paenibacillus amylolyticus]|uniref:hypothetical protein n=1 Tax=Paenibacillus amylolyticus TaxID=1451 RepID=UPI000FD9CE53|nr:hypothetical protein [Paenibacillus amylolyticus]